MRRVGTLAICGTWVGKVRWPKWSYVNSVGVSAQRKQVSRPRSAVARFVAETANRVDLLVDHPAECLNGRRSLRVVLRVVQRQRLRVAGRPKGEHGPPLLLPPGRVVGQR